MSPTDNLRRQHRELLEIAGEIAPLLKVEALSRDATAVRKQLSALTGKLGVHLSMEDRAMYPKLLAHADPAVSTVARRYSTEMGGIKAVLDAYNRRWSTPENIQREAAEFVRETQGLFSALATRIRKEDTELYAVVDRVGLG